MVSPLLTVLCLVIVGMVSTMCCGIFLVFKHICNRSSSKATKITTVRFRKKGFLSRAACSNEICGVCLEEFKLSEDIDVCPCFHGYHAECLHNWLQVKNQCPICQDSLVNAHGETTPLLRVYTIDI